MTAASDAASRHATAVRLLEGGKRVGDVIYMHTSLVREQATDVRALVAEACALARPTAFTVVRLALRRPEVGLLDYPLFFEEPFPALRSSWLVDLAMTRVVAGDFAARENPPILHRKELLLGRTHPERERFAKLTAALMDFGAFDRPAHLIGQRVQWARVLASLGLRVEGHKVVPGDGVVRPGPGETAVGVARHRTAIARSQLSAPMRALARWGFLDGDPSVLDYGCGRGDDVRALSAAGVRATGWDPHYAPEAPRDPADAVNLGFVLNVIEEPVERAEALRRAYALARRVLAVAVMTAGKGSGADHSDGVLTARNTFQKYFGQAELRAYVADVLGREPVTIGPGLIFVFRSDEEEQAFLARRQRSAAPADESRFAMPPVLAGAAPAKAYERYGDLLDAFWDATLELGRLPEPDEFGRYEELHAAVGSPKRAFAALPFADKKADLTRAAERRSGDMVVYLALNLFEQRASFGSLPAAVQRDVKGFFGSHKAALDRARSALMAVGDGKLTAAAAASGAEERLGILDAEDGDYTFHASLLDRQPVPIRILLGCAERLEPLPATTDLVKVHGSGGRVSYLGFDDFAARSLPVLARRTVVDLRRRRVSEVPVDTPDGRRVLLGKASLMPPDMPGRGAQERFDNRLRRCGILVQPGLGPGLRVLMRRLADAGLVSTRRRAPGTRP
ncbi:MAG TPA: DNA phosphorothioation-associated putative methyltransferase [Stellaceae bacterium]|nr:DNA phosphorothioation-associated putative methyltransferase [Stellaceae bacterium]